jgi:hypothetical protein
VPNMLMRVARLFGIAGWDDLAMWVLMHAELFYAFGGRGAAPGEIVLDSLTLRSLDFIDPGLHHCEHRFSFLKRVRAEL